MGSGLGHDRDGRDRNHAVGKVLVGNHMPRWWLDVATAIHFYEAVLATLAIAVWHFYQAFFDPDVYPMNWAWWDGKMTLHHCREEHGRDRTRDRTRIAEPTGEPALAEPGAQEEPEATGVKHGH